MNIQGWSVIKGGPSVESATFYCNLGWTLRDMMGAFVDAILYKTMSRVEISLGYSVRPLSWGYFKGTCIFFHIEWTPWDVFFFSFPTFPKSVDQNIKKDWRTLRNPLPQRDFLYYIAVTVSNNTNIKKNKSNNQIVMLQHYLYNSRMAEWSKAPF